MGLEEEKSKEKFFVHIQLILASLFIYGLAPKPFMKGIFILSLMIFVALFTKLIKPKIFEPLFLTFYLATSLILVSLFSWEHGQKIFTKQLFDHLPQIPQSIFWDFFLISIFICILIIQIYYYIKWLKMQSLTHL